MTDELATTLAVVVGWLDAAHVPFMIAGSFASTYHGHPRATHDVDIVIDPSRESLNALLDLLPTERVYADRISATEAFAARDMFNVIDLESGWKLDFILRKNRAFSRAEFARRVGVEWMGVHLFVATAEDVVLSKLEWAELGGGSERQLRDVAGVVQARGKELDVGYIESWLDVLGVRHLWTRVLATS